MDQLTTGRLLRMLRIRRRWRLIDLAGRSGLSPATLARHELGTIASVERLRRHAAALDTRLELRLIGRGAELPRLRDEEHAAIVDAVAAAFVTDGWTIEAEASFSEWGERGRADLLAHRTRELGSHVAVVEVKTEIADLQELLGSLNVKERLAPVLAARRGWAVERVSAVLALASTARNRAILGAHPTLFRSFAARTLRARGGPVAATRTLLWVPPARARRSQWLAGRRRVRRPTGSASEREPRVPLTQRGVRGGVGS